MNVRRRAGIQGRGAFCWLLHPRAEEAFKCFCGRKALGFLWVLCQRQPLWCLDPFLLVAQIVTGASAISSSLCRIISRSTVYLGTETAAVESRRQHTPPLGPASQVTVWVTAPSLCFCHWPSIATWLLCSFPQQDKKD